MRNSKHPKRNYLLGFCCVLVFVFCFFFCLTRRAPRGNDRTTSWQTHTNRFLSYLFFHYFYFFLLFTDKKIKERVLYTLLSSSSSFFFKAETATRTEKNVPDTHARTAIVSTVPPLVLFPLVLKFFFCRWIKTNNQKNKWRVKEKGQQSLSKNRERTHTQKKSDYIEPNSPRTIHQTQLQTK